jgi:hypothetical protein
LITDLFEGFAMTTTAASVAALDRPMTTSWNPPAGTKDHLGEALPPDLWFFQGPPLEIGEVASAWGTARLGEEVKSPWVVKGALVGVALAALFSVISIAFTQRPGQTPVVQLTVSGIVGLALGLWFAKANLRKFPVVTYVGRLGAARYTMREGPQNPAAAEVLRFADAAELRTSMTRRFVNGAYQGTMYSFIWTDSATKQLLRIMGTHKAKEGLPPASDLFCFGAAAEMAWSNYRLAGLEEQLIKSGFVQFNVSGNDYVRVAPAAFEFHFGGETQRITADQIKTLSLSQGTFHIVSKDAGWFGRKGKFHFAYGNIANALLFRLAIRKLIGWEV